MENEDMIRKQMEETRTSLTEKLETLEGRLLNTVEETTQAVNETVANVKESVQDGMEAVKDALDVKAHVERHPWLMLSGSVLCGYVLGTLLSEARRPAQIAETPAPPQLSSRGLQANGNGRQKVDLAQSGPSSDWLSFLEPEIKKLKGLALGATLGTVREMISSEVPMHMAEQVRDLIDGVTRKMGGDPIPSSDWDKFRVPSGTAPDSESPANKARWEM